jgi:hypothetical protein
LRSMRSENRSNAGLAIVLSFFTANSVVIGVGVARAKLL